jgi:hypothetical protein
VFADAFAELDVGETSARFSLPEARTSQRGRDRRQIGADS